MTTQAQSSPPPTTSVSGPISDITSLLQKSIAWMRTNLLGLIPHLWKTQRPWIALVLIALVLLYRPFTWFWEIWSAPDSPLSYQPLVPLGVLFLAWMDRGPVRAAYTELAYLFPANSPKRQGKIWPVLTGCFLMLVSYLMTLPPLAMLSFLLMVVGVIYYIYGPFILNALRKPLSYFLVMAPVPNVIVSMATQKLQLSCAAIAGQILAIFHPQVKVVGTFIKLPGYALEVIGPCSGVSILFPVAAMTIWLAMVRRMKILPSILLLCIGAALSLIMNILRIVMMGMVGVYNPTLAQTLHDMNSVAFTALAFYLTFLAANLLGRRLSITLPTLRRAPTSLGDTSYYSDVHTGQHPTVADVAALRSQGTVHPVPQPNPTETETEGKKEPQL